MEPTRPPNGASTITNPNGTQVTRSAGSDPTGEPGPVTLVLDPNQNISGAIFEGLDYEEFEDLVHSIAQTADHWDDKIARL